ncbi:MAG: hypothetical protein KJ556_21755 [Gammaproteobacteria bacterium]|nr:hypothetical protein [Gammaproteobacteria bacterium]
MPIDLPPDEPTTLFEWLWRLKFHEDHIFVRENIGDGFMAVPISQLPPWKWAHHVAGWLEFGHLPLRVRTKEEIKDGGDK